MTPSTDTVVESSAGAVSARAEIGVIGGSGFYEFLTDSERVSITTPFGDPSDDVVVGDTASTTAPTSGRCARSVFGRCWHPAPWAP